MKTIDILKEFIDFHWKPIDFLREFIDFHYKPLQMNSLRNSLIFIENHWFLRPPVSDFDDPFSKNNDFGTRQRIQRIPADPAELPETSPSAAAPTPPSTRAGGQDDGS